jgi:23S rRNA (uracil1939-C5)-methyltransferase
VTVPAELRSGEEVEIEGAGLDERGAGVVELGDHRVHVAGLLPGERGRATIEHVSVHRVEGRRPAWARLDTLLVSSPDRVAPVCPAHGPCGGCPLQHLEYAAQVRWKGARVKEALSHHPSLAGVPVAACVPSARVLGYRNQAKYVYGRDQASGRLVLGAYLPRSHDLVDLAGCQVVEPVLDQVAHVLRDLLDARGVAPFDEVRRTGLLRYVVLRANSAGAVLVALVAAREWPEAAGLASELQARAAAVSGVVLNVNAAPGNTLFGDEERTLAGRPNLEDEIGPVRVELASRSFFQLNRETAGRAYQDLQRAVAALGPVGRAVDAYAGAGGIAFCLAPLVSQVVAIEENAAATAAAAAFAQRRGLPVRFETADAALALERIPDADVVVLNPPRGGCAPEVLAAVARLRPRLVAYLSCHPGTLGRDLDLLQRLGLSAREVLPYDMLPHTPHVEALALLAPTDVPSER